MQDEVKASGESPPRRMSGGVKLLLGCGCLSILGVVVCAGLIGVGLYYGMGHVNEFAESFENQGYTRVVAQQLTETEPIDSSKVYMVQRLVVQQGALADIAIAAQIAELHGHFDGDVHFLGQMLHVKPDATIAGDVRVETGQVITVEGVVEGEVTGSYQVLQDQRQDAMLDVDIELGETDESVEAGAGENPERP